MKAIMKPNMFEIVIDFFGEEEGLRTDQGFINLCNRIAGKEVELRFVGPDAFEKVDNIFCLPDCSWDEVKP